MKRLVGKVVFLFVRWIRFFFGRVAPVATLPCALFEERFIRSVPGGSLSLQPVLPPVNRFQRTARLPAI